MKKRKTSAKSDHVSVANLFDSLPVDVAWFLFGFLSVKDIFIVTSLCRSLRCLLHARRNDRVKLSLFPDSRTASSLQECLFESTNVSKLGERIVSGAGVLEGLTIRCVTAGSQGEML
jgi:hypothetical protein